MTNTSDTWYRVVIGVPRSVVGNTILLHHRHKRSHLLAYNDKQYPKTSYYLFVQKHIQFKTYK